MQENEPTEKHEDIESSIKHLFRYIYEDGLWSIQGLPNEYPAEVFRRGSEIGVRIKFPEHPRNEVNEQSSGVKYVSRFSSDENATFLELASSERDYRDAFSVICSNFVNPGDRGEKRRAILKNPLEWWTGWKEIMGNKNVDEMPYSILGELIAYAYIKKLDPLAKWEGCKSGTVDIVGSKENFEVKSTLKRYDYVVSISGQHQLKPSDRPLNLIFCRFEKSRAGITIGNVVDKFPSYEEKQEIISTLSDQGIQKGSMAYGITSYKLLEMNIYPVDEKFPRIDDCSFKGDICPPGIIKIQYSIDLSGCKHKTLENDKIQEKYTSVQL